MVKPEFIHGCWTFPLAGPGFASDLEQAWVSLLVTWHVFFHCVPETSISSMIGAPVKNTDPRIHSNSLNEHAGGQGLRICISRWPHGSGTHSDSGMDACLTRPRSLGIRTQLFKARWAEFRSSGVFCAVPSSLPPLLSLMARSLLSPRSRRSFWDWPYFSGGSFRRGVEIKPTFPREFVLCSWH